MYLIATFVHKAQKNISLHCYTIGMNKGLLFGFMCACFFVAQPVLAATLYMDPNQAELKRGDTIRVSVRLDAGDNECVNVVDATITYSENIEPVDISRGQSILSMWVEEPKINKDKHTITFAGGIPNGYCGRIPGDPRLTNNVVDLLFQSPGMQIGNSKNGNEVAIDFTPETQVLLNDGLGTIANTKLFGSKISLTKDAGTEIINPWQETVKNDKILPEKFSISLEHTTNAYSNDYFIVFNTTDKQSGIDHYEVIEEPLSSKNLFGWGASTAPWSKVRSPYVLQDQSLNSTIRVKAIDKAGNEYIAVYLPDVSKRTFSKDNKIIISILIVAGTLFLSGLGLLIVFYRRRKIKLQNLLSQDDDTKESL